MSTMEERLDVIETRLDQLRVPPVRDELIRLRDVHGLRLDAIDGRLRAIEFELSETTSWIERRLTDVDNELGDIKRQLEAILTAVRPEGS